MAGNRFDLVIFDNDGVLVDSEREVAEGRLGRPLPTDLEDRYHERLFDTFRTTLTAVPGVADALAQIETPTCVASSGTHERIRLSLTTTGLFGRFAGRIFSAQDVALGKPAPDLFLHAAKERLRAATGGIFTSMNELPTLLRRM